MNTTLLRLGLPSVFAALFGLAALRAPGPQEPTFTVHEITGPIAWLEGAGGNIGLCNGPDGFFMIDNQYARYEEPILGAVAGYLGVDPSLALAAPLYLLNTHWHGDHVGNNAAFGRSKVPILAHSNVRRRMAGEPGVEGRTGSEPREALPTLTFDDELQLHLNGESITVRHHPAGHTDGDSVVFFHTSKVVHMGDLFFNGRFPFIDTGSGGSPSGYAAAQARVLEEVDDTWKIIPGHGPLGSRADLQASLSMLTTCIERVRGALGEGKSVETMLSEGLLSDFEQAWTWNFIQVDRFTADLAAGLAQEDRRR